MVVVGSWEHEQGWWWEVGSKARGSAQCLVLLVGGWLGVWQVLI